MRAGRGGAGVGEGERLLFRLLLLWGMVVDVVIVVIAVVAGHGGIEVDEWSWVLRIKG